MFDKNKFIIPVFIFIIILLLYYPEFIFCTKGNMPSAVEIKLEVDASSTVVNNGMLSQSQTAKEALKSFAETQVKLLKACTQAVEATGVTGKAKLHGILDCVELLTKDMPKKDN